MNRESVLEALGRDHDQILALTETLANTVRDLGETERGRLSDSVCKCQEQLRSLRQAFLSHRCREEVGLFPDVERMVSSGAPRVDILGEFFAAEAEDDIGAHLDVEGNLKKIASLLDSLTARGAAQEAVASELGDIAEKTKDLLVRHASKEDEVIFPMMARLLSDEQVAAITPRLRDLCSDMDDSGE